MAEPPDSAADTCSQGLRDYRGAIARSRHLQTPGGNGFVLSEYDLNGVWKGDLIYFNGRPLAKLTSGSIDSVLYFVNDHLGTPVALVDNAKQIRWSAKWYPFGEIYDEQVSATNFLSFPGQWEDDESDLSYNWHRYYSPNEGRYYQADPIGLNGGTNLYSYSASNPTRYNDPSCLDYFRDPEGNLLWFESQEPFIGGVGPNAGSRLHDVLGNEIGPDQTRFIPNRTVDYEEFGREVLSKDIGFWPWDIYGEWKTGGECDLKNSQPFTPDEYVSVDGSIYLSQDLGNLLFGVYTAKTPYRFWVMQLGGGIVQLFSDLDKGEFHAEYFKDFFDDPRGAHFVKLGRSQFQAWLFTGKLPR